MNEIKYQELIAKLSQHIDIDSVDLSVSPTLGSDCGYATSDPYFLTRETDIEQLSQNQLYYTHTLLHTLYGRGGNKTLNKTDIEMLHNEVKTKINHSSFDKLDKIK